MVEERYSLALWDASPRTQIELGSLTRSTSQDIIIHDKAAGHVYGNDDSALPSLGGDLETYGNWYSVASTIFNKLYQISQFDPSTVEYSATAFVNLRHFFSSSPYWNSQFSVVSRDVSISPQDYKPAVKVMDEFLTAIEIAPNIEAQIISNVRKIAQLASTPDDLSQKQSMCYNATIANTAGTLHVLVLYGVVSMEMNQQKGRYQVIAQDTKLVLGRGAIDFDFCKRHARNILNYGKHGIELWEGQAAAHSQAENTSDGWPPGS